MAVIQGSSVVTSISENLVEPPRHEYDMTYHEVSTWSSPDLECSTSVKILGNIRHEEDN